MTKYIREWNLRVYVSGIPIKKGLVIVDKCGIFPITNGEAKVKMCPTGQYICKIKVYEYGNKKVDYLSEEIPIYMNEYGWSGINLSEDDIIKRSKPEPKKEKSYIEVSLDLYNPSGNKPDAEKIQNEVNAVCNYVGWNCYQVSTSPTKIILYFQKQGSPALPIMAIIGVIAIIVAGAVIISINWRIVRVEEEDTKQELEKTKQLKTNKDLYDAITEEYNKGLITDETYNNLIEQLGYSQFNLSKPITKPTQPSNNWIDTISGILPIILIIMLIGAIKK